ncbi:MAG: hypothetical protein IPO88_21175 [Nannocystis sp.]|uniref:hypothetical protein n=1 Tax=Nannocystis sp. TaxID=1962667 RepID=UPI0024275B1A|nr:hypothetical protein [Nannocystis sp.]MBK9755965.1 hypothetical protein [Nannocystis sp.]
MALLISACAPVARATLPTTPPRGAVRVDLEEMKECLQLQRRADTPRISSVERPLLAARLAELPLVAARRGDRAGRPLKPPAGHCGVSQEAQLMICVFSEPLRPPPGGIAPLSTSDSARSASMTAASYLSKSMPVGAPARLPR